MKLICGCLLVMGLLGCLTEAQYFKKPQTPQQPNVPKIQPPPPPPRQRPQTPPKKIVDPQPYPKPQEPKELTPVFHTCELEENCKIQCGAPGISSSDCEAINCCFDGRMCYYGKSGEYISLILKNLKKYTALTQNKVYPVCLKSSMGNALFFLNSLK